MLLVLNVGCCRSCGDPFFYRLSKVPPQEGSTFRLRGKASSYIKELLKRERDF
jgi:hypothetical protein